MLILATREHDRILRFCTMASCSLLSLGTCSLSVEAIHAIIALGTYTYLSELSSIAKYHTNNRLYYEIVQSVFSSFWLSEVDRES